MAERMTRGDVLELLRGGRARLEEAIARVDQDRLEAPGLAGGAWSVKDMMAHVAFWEALMVGRLGGPRPAVDWAGDVDSTNAAVYEASRGRPLAEVRREFDAVHRDLLARIEALSDDELSSPRKPGAERALWEEIRDETWGHYPEHVADLESRGTR